MYLYLFILKADWVKEQVKYLLCQMHKYFSYFSSNKLAFIDYSIKNVADNILILLAYVV